jgi:hypothetical protein
MINSRMARLCNASTLSFRVFYKPDRLRATTDSGHCANADLRKRACKFAITRVAEMSVPGGVIWSTWRFVHLLKKARRVRKPNMDHAPFGRSTGAKSREPSSPLMR